MTTTEDLSFHGGDPGAVKYGNFINYYSFHSVKERMENLNSAMFPAISNDTIFCLDIGCNTGELSKELYSYIETIYPNKNLQMLAIDIDPVLVHRAQETNTNSSITFLALNVMTQQSKEEIKKYLNSHKKEQFDVTFCFSVTMWIHLNNGDKGLQEFLKYVKEISNTILIEPQPWNCYRNAQRRVKKSGCSFPFYETIKIRSNVAKEIEYIILSDNYHKKVYESSASSWKRKVQSYQQIS